MRYIPFFLLVIGTLGLIFGQRKQHKLLGHDLPTSAGMPRYYFLAVFIFIIGAILCIKHLGLLGIIPIVASSLFARIVIGKDT